MSFESPLSVASVITDTQDDLKTLIPTSIKLNTWVCTSSQSATQGLKTFQKQILELSQAVTYSNLHLILRETEAEAAKFCSWLYQWEHRMIFISVELFYLSGKE